MFINTSNGEKAKHVVERREYESHKGVSHVILTGQVLKVELPL